jgi:hypothetical protein
VGHVVVSLPRLAALIPLADQPKLNAQLKAWQLRNPQNQYLGSPRRKVKRNEKEKETKEKKQLRLRKVSITHAIDFLSPSICFKQRC